MKRLVFAFILLLPLSLQAQVDRKEVRAGNRKFRRGDFKEAEIDYRKAVVKDSLSVAGQYNLASSLYRQQDYDGAEKALECIGETAASGRYAARYHYNAGDVALQKKDYAAAAKAFREALLLDPGDLDAKENYIYAKKMMQRDQGGSGGEGQQDRNQDQDQDQNQEQEQPQEQPRDDRQQEQEQQQEQQGQQISPRQAQQMLQAIQAKEKETKDKVDKEKAAALRSRQKEKNW